MSEQSDIFDRWRELSLEVDIEASVVQNDFDRDESLTLEDMTQVISQYQNQRYAIMRKANTLMRDTNNFLEEYRNQRWPEKALASLDEERESKV